MKNQKIRQLRFKAGLTQEQLAEKLGIGAQSVSKWENAVAMPDITALPLLAVRPDHRAAAEPYRKPNGC